MCTYDRLELHAEKIFTMCLIKSSCLGSSGQGRNYLKSDPECSYIFKRHVLEVDLVIYGARKARDPARVVDGAELCRRHNFSAKVI